MEEKPEEKILRISSKSAEYPEKLNNYPKMPEILFVKGRLPDRKKPSIAIVGARACSTYGRIQAFRYAKVLSSAGVQIISGMAYGIDAEAHKGALEGGTATYAVLAGGVDICYPAGNKALYERILREGGGIISEQPPGMRARNYFFPARNPDHKWTCGYGAHRRGKRKKWFAYHSTVGIGSGKNSLCDSGTCK